MRPGMMVYFDIVPALELLTDTERGELFSAILRYGMYGEVPAFTGATALAWAFMQPRLDADANRYDDVILQKRYAVYCRECRKAENEPLSYAEWREQQITDDNDRCIPMTDDNGRYPTTTTSTTTSTTTNSTQNNNIADKPPNKRFIPPSVEEVAKYCAERKNGLDAQAFIDHYESNGWKVGRNSMKDWKAAVRTWERSEHNYGGNEHLPRKTETEGAAGRFDNLNLYDVE